MENVSSKQGRWQVKYFVLGATTKITRTNDGYPQISENMVAIFTAEDGKECKDGRPVM